MEKLVFEGKEYFFLGEIGDPVIFDWDTRCIALGWDSSSGYEPNSGLSSIEGLNDGDYIAVRVTDTSLAHLKSNRMSGLHYGRLGRVTWEIWDESSGDGCMHCMHTSYSWTLIPESSWEKYQAEDLVLTPA